MSVCFYVGDGLGMKRWMAGPIFLFFLGFCQALSPYLYWSLYERNNTYVYDISYYPAWIWVLGFASFSAGALIVGGRLRPDPVAETSRSERDKAKRVVIVLLLTSFIGVGSVISGVYGGIPLLGYIQGTIEVNEVNQVQTSALSGQLGFVLACSFALTMALVVYLRNLEMLTAGRRVFIIFILIFIVFQSTMAGKRQGLMMLMVSVACCFILSGKSPGRQVSAIMGLSASSKMLGVLIAASSVCLVFCLFGFLAVVRTGSDLSSFNAIGAGFDQVLLYLQLPLINFEVQAENCGWGPGADNLWGPFQNLIPYKIQQDFFLDQGLLDVPPRAEPGIGAGFYGSLHWFWGIDGVAIFSILCGALCQWIYMKSASSSLALAVYCQLAWTLIAAHTYNHFLMLVYSVIPIAMFFGAMLLIGGWDFSRSRFQSRRLNRVA